MQYESNNIILTCDTDINQDEAQAYIDHYLEKFPNLAALDIKIDSDYADVTYTLQDSPAFERVRRITGYLVGTLDRFNDAKRAEEADRVKHPTL
ncbi:MAG: hypothetical protein HFJ65_06645 [Eggerthellaceae bacterium]|nr:hypothetical protein [Eggerthellaceae bacterium]